MYNNNNSGAPYKQQHYAVMLLPLFLILVVFFLYLLSISEFDNEKSRQVQESLFDSFGSTKIISPTLNEAALYESWQTQHQQIATIADLRIALQQSQKITVIVDQAGRNITLSVLKSDIFHASHALTNFATNMLKLLLPALKRIDENAQMLIAYDHQQTPISENTKKNILSLQNYIGQHSTLPFTITMPYQQQGDMLHIKAHL